jgi:hypothetical protein
MMLKQPRQSIEFTEILKYYRRWLITDKHLTPVASVVKAKEWSGFAAEEVTAIPSSKAKAVSPISLPLLLRLLLLWL